MGRDRPIRDDGGRALVGDKHTGQAPGPKAATSRTLLLMLADVQFFGAMGFISTLATGKRQRLGDMVAGTLVVRRRSLRKSPR